MLCGIRWSAASLKRMKRRKRDPKRAIRRELCPHWLRIPRVAAQASQAVWACPRWRFKFRGKPYSAEPRAYNLEALDHRCTGSRCATDTAIRWNEEGRRLNRAYRGKDYPTDVLTFSYASKPAVRADVVLCVPVIRREAREQALMYDHLAHLIVHAVLHAQAYHHDNAVAARRLAA